MLAMIILILKILGILILSVLGLVILLLILLFFAPIKYKSDGIKEDDIIKINAYVTYLNPLVRMNIHYPEQTIAEVKILFFTVYTKKENSEQPVNSEENANNDKQDDVIHAQNRQQAKPADIPEGRNNKKISDVKEEEQNKSSTKENSVEDKENKNLLDKITEYAQLLIDNKSLLLDVINTVLKALKSILPKKCNIKVVFGTGQADTTGYICAIYYAIAELLPENFEIYYEPVWTEKAFKGNYKISGKIRLIYIISAAIKIVANKKVRKLFKLIRSV